MANDNQEANEELHNDLMQVVEIYEIKHFENGMGMMLEGEEKLIEEGKHSIGESYYGHAGN